MTPDENDFTDNDEPNDNDQLNINDQQNINYQQSYKDQVGNREQGGNRELSVSGLGLLDRFELCLASDSWIELRLSGLGLLDRFVSFVWPLAPGFLDRSLDRLCWAQFAVPDQLFG